MLGRGRLRCTSQLTKSVAVLALQILKKWNLYYSKNRLFQHRLQRHIV